MVLALVILINESCFGTHLNMEIYVGTRWTQSVAICCNVTHLGVTRERRYYKSGHN
jgi:hypothetical protein